jgi:hypothetical protein
VGIKREVIFMRIRGGNLIFSLFWLALLFFPFNSVAQEIRLEGWPLPDLTGLIPYSITVKKTDGVEKVVEKFYTLNGGHIARISGNGKVFAYAVDSNQEPPIDYLLLDPDGNGKFTQKIRPEDLYLIPEWVSN